MISEMIEEGTVQKLEALKAQQIREHQEQKEKEIRSIILHLESHFSRNGGEPTYLPVYGLTEEIEKDLWPQYKFLKVKPNLYYIKRGK